jgi:hypothetical protein
MEISGLRAFEIQSSDADTKALFERGLPGARNAGESVLVRGVDGVSGIHDRENVYRLQGPKIPWLGLT